MFRLGGALLFVLVFTVGFVRISPVASIILLCVGAISSGIASLVIPGIFDWILMVMFSEQLRKSRGEPKHVAGIERSAHILRVWLPFGEIVVGVVGLVWLTYASL
jgi:hypothetical protein